MHARVADALHWPDTLVPARADVRTRLAGGMDTELVARAQQGDHEAFTTIVNAVAHRLHGVAHGILRDREQAEEATQQGIVNIWRDLPKLRDPSRFEPWAYRVVINVCYSEARRAKRWMPDLTPGSRAEPRAGDGIDAVLDRDELEQGLRSLSVDHRTILALRYYLDYPLEEIADSLDIPVGTAKSRLNRATSALRAAMEAHAREREARAGSGHDEVAP